MASGLTEPDPIPVSLRVESALIEALSNPIEANPARSGDDVPRRLLFSTTGPGTALAQWLPGQIGSDGISLDVFEPEHYRFRKLCQSLGLAPSDPTLGSGSASGTMPTNGGIGEAVAESEFARLICAADVPANTEYDFAALALRRDWSAEWGRDLIQQFACALKETGWLILAVDHPDDAWVGDQLRGMTTSPKAIKRSTGFGTSGNTGTQPSSPASGRRGRDARKTAEASGVTVYRVPADAMQVRLRDFRCEFAFRDAGRLIQAISRPGVFSHRRLDLGARRLLDMMEIEPGCKVLDLGCGWGPIALAAALRHPSVMVTAVDSHARAIECTRRGAAANERSEQIDVRISSDGTVPQAGSYDLVLANPPYYNNLRIAELFLQAGQHALAAGGRLVAVAKQPDWYQIHMPRWFDRVEIRSAPGGYCIASGTRLQTS